MRLKRVIKYLKNTTDYGIEYIKVNLKPEVKGYCDSDYANDIGTRRSTSGYLFEIGNGAVTWSSRRQKCVSLSTMEAEYVAACEASKEAVWIRNLLQDLNPRICSDPITLKVDNQGAIRLAMNQDYHKRTKHIDIRYHYIREKLEDNAIAVEYDDSKHEKADILTKALPREHFQKLRSAIGMKNAHVFKNE